MEQEPKINRYLRQMLSLGGSDLHLSINFPAKARVHGNIQPLDDVILTPEVMEEMLKEICLPPKRWTKFMETHDLDFAHEIPGLARFRCNYFYNYHGMGCVLRQIPSKILTMQELKLPETLVEICNYKSGLVLVTGPTGSGKSTTLAAMIDYINDNLHKHIITIEDPIEFVHQNKNCTIVHREVGIHSESFPRALRGAMRSDPDIVLIGEMRDNETIRLGLTCAAMGMLVFATMHTNNAPKTIDRIIDSFPAEQQNQIRIQLADVLECAVGQTLLPKIGGGRTAVFEIMIVTPAIRSMILQSKTFQIVSAIQTGKRYGMQLLDDALEDLVDRHVISLETALAAANEPDKFKTGRQT